MSSKKISAFAVLFLLCSFSVATAADRNAVLSAWSHQNSFQDSGGTEQNLALRATYYSNEFVEALVAAEAEKNLWTKDEMENFKYTLLKNLNLGEAIPFHIYMEVTGVPMYASPFDRYVTLMVKGKRYSPIDYDKRFNFKIIGQRDGMVFFPRYDPKTGKEILEGAKELRLIFSNSISHALSAQGRDLIWVWDLTKDRGKINEGKAADRLEADRLLKRSDKLKTDREALLKQLEALDKEYSDVNSRIDELQSK